MNILVVNLTRFGDLLQSAATLRSLARSSGKTGAIGVVCLDNFLAGAELLPEVAAIYPLAAGQIMAELHMTAAGERRDASWLDGLTALHTWVGKVRRHFAPDMVCNLSPTIAACLLSRLLAGDKPLVGFALDGQGRTHNSSPWATFVQGSSASRAASPFNVVDLFRKAANDTGLTADGTLLPAPAEAVTAIGTQLRAASPPECAGYLALQLGASAPARQWPVASFAAVGNALWQSHKLLPLLLGTKGETPLAEEYATYATSPFLSLMGKTGITELAATLTLSSLLISNDTGTLHLGSGLGTPVLGLYLATAQVCDTGPYALGSCALEPDLACHPCDFGTTCPRNYACHTAIRPETVLALAASRLDENCWSKTLGQTPAVGEGARIWETTRDPFGFADLTSLSGHGDHSAVRWLRVQRALYRQLFDETPLPQDLLPPDTALAADIAAACDAILPLLDACVIQAEMVATSPIPQVWERFSRTWERMNMVFASLPHFAPAAFVWRSESPATEGIDAIVLLLRRYRDFFRSAKAAVSA